MWKLLVVLAACDGGPNEVTVATFPLRIVVTSDAIAVYTDGMDFPDGSCVPFEFPALGACAGTSDAQPCDVRATSCITDLGVELDGRRLVPTHLGGSDPHRLGYAPFGTGALALELEGCGHPRTEIPLGSGPYPDATIDAYFVDNTPHVAWTTDSGDEALVTTQFGLFDEVCRVGGTREEVSTHMRYAYWADVQPLSPPRELDTAFGHATIWHAGEATAAFPPVLCDPYTNASCSAGHRCAQSHAGEMCEVDGTIPVGGACASGDACVQGSGCAEDAICRAYCDDAHPCASGACELGAYEIGFCR